MKVIVATGNAGKMQEFSRIFAPYGIETVAQGHLYPDLDVDETGTDFAQNAFIKANAVFQLSGKASVADDSGLCVDALDGRPGVHTARYGGDVSYPEKMRLLLEELGGLPVDYRAAQFVCHICYIDASGQRFDFTGECHGYIGAEPKGEKGFGFDPIFMIGSQSFAELDEQKKDAISHRGRALRALAQHLGQTYDLNTK